MSSPVSTKSGDHPRDRSDAELVAAARQGQRWACEELVSRHAPSVNALAYHLLGTDVDLDDLVQDCFVEALSHLKAIRDPDAFAGWLRQIVVHTTARLIRRRRLRRRLGLETARSMSIDQQVDALRARGAPPDVVLELRRVYRVVELLPTEQRVALVLRRIERFSLDEIAHLTKTSMMTVRRRIARAEATLAIAFPGEKS